MFFNKGDFVKLKEKKFPRKLKGIAKVIEIYGLGIVEYSVRSESGSMIALRAQAYYVPGLPKDLRIILPLSLLIEYSTIPNPDISRPFAMPLRFLGNFFSSSFTKSPLLEEHE